MPSAPQNPPRAAMDIRLDYAAYEYWFKTEFGSRDSEIHGFAKDLLWKVIKNEMTPKQRKYFLAYYFEGLTMREIAEQAGCEKSTVSRTIKRAKQRILRVFKYTDRRIYSMFENNEALKRSRHVADY